MTPVTAGTPLRILVCGEPARGDDAVAFAAVEALPAEILARTLVVHCGQLEVDHLLDVPDGDACVIVDAAVGVAPGEVVAISLEAIAARSGPAVPRSSHTLPPDEAIRLAAALQGRPPAGVFLGIGGSDFRLGAGLSPAVRSALPEFVERIVTEILRLTAEEDRDPERAPQR